MDALPRHADRQDDLSALAWVHDELRRALEAAHKSMRRFLRDTESTYDSDVDTVEPAVLRSARQHLHQGVGALELVGLPAAAALLRASENALARFTARPNRFDLAAVELIEQASFALLDYLGRLLAGKPVSSLALFPQYCAVQALVGAERVHPADLWSVDWQWRQSPPEDGVAPRACDAPARAEFEAVLLAAMRGDAPSAQRLSDLAAALAAGAAGDAHARSLWQLTAAFFEAQSHGLLKPDNYSKRVASRLLGQARQLERGDGEVSQRLAQDLLFFCAHARAADPARPAQRLAAVRRLHGLEQVEPVDYETPRLGRFDPALIVQARKRVAGAKDAWSSVAGGELHRFSGLVEQFSLVGDSLQRLHPDGAVLAQALHDAVEQTVISEAAPAPTLAMEVATAMLYLEAALETAEFDHPEHAARVARLAERIAQAGAGQAPGPLESWMEELYRRVSDRQTMGSVVQELRASLSEAEKLIDQFFRKPEDRHVLIPVPSQLAAMRGVLSVLGMDQASQAVLRMRDEIDALIAQPQSDAAEAAAGGRFERLAGNLGALGFLIDMLSVQPQLAKSLFAYDPVSGVLNPLMGRAPAPAAAEPTDPLPSASSLVEQALSLAVSAADAEVPLADVARDLDRMAADARAAAHGDLLQSVSEAQQSLHGALDDDRVQATRDELAGALADFVVSVSDAVALSPEPALAPPPPAAPVAAPTGLEDDDEMREVFLEEAREVLDTAGGAVRALAAADDDIGELTTVRRAFHTLKGSSRMVGLSAFGDAAWAFEQLYNARLADTPRADEPLLTLTTQALTYLADWVEAIAERRDGGHQAAAVNAAADLLRIEGRRVALPLPGAGPAPTAESVERVPLVFAPAVPPSSADADADAAPRSTADVDLPFELDLRAFDASLAATAPPDEPVAAPAAAATPTPSDDLAAAAPPVEPLFALDPALPPERPAADGAGGDADADAADEPVEPVAAAVPSLDLPDVIEADLDAPPLDPIADAPEPAESAAIESGAAESVAESSSAGEPASTFAESASAPLQHEAEQVKVVGSLRISIPLFNIYLNEADELSRRLCTELAEWAMELHRPVGETAIALAHSLAGSSATVGFAALSQLARSLEHALVRAHAAGHGSADEGQLFVEVADELRRLLHQFAAGFLKAPPASLLERLAAHELGATRRLDEAATPVASERAAALAPVVAAAPPLPAAAPPLPAAEPPMPADEPPAAADVPAEFPALAESSDAAAAIEPTTADAAKASPAQAAEPAPAAPMAGFAAFGQAELKAFEPLAEPRPALSRAAAADAFDDADDLDAIDAVDAELFPIFEEEGQELLPQLASRMRDWQRRPGDSAGPSGCMRTLHTLKGGARLAGAMRLGEMAHRLEAAIEQLAARGDADAADIETLQGRVDALLAAFESLRQRDAAAYAQAAASADGVPPATMPTAPVAAVLADAAVDTSAPPPEAAVHATADAAPAEPARAVAAVSAQPARGPDIDWSSFGAAAEPSGHAEVAASPLPERRGPDRPGAGGGAVRVRAPLLDRLVNHAGEVSITRSRIESEVAQLRGSLHDLDDNLERLRAQLRDIELQAETQISSRLEAARAASQSFDPLEMDRFTRFQELTRMMAESVNDVATVQRSLAKTLQQTEDELAAQARLTRDLQDDLLRTRMVEFEGLSDRLYRVVRMAAKETGKQVRLDIVGGSIEIDRGVLERMTPAFEHLLRNCITHGVESPELRASLGKDPAGRIVVALSHEGNEVAVEFRDDGAGLNLPKIRQRGVAMGLLDANAAPTDAELANLIFEPGFSTADTITELAGRGVGMDVVRADVNAMGGRIETATTAGQGTGFKLVLPLTTAVTQVVMLRCGETAVAVPSTLVEIVRRAKPEELDQAYASGIYLAGERALPFFWLGALLQSSPRGLESGRTLPVIVIRSAQQRIALHVDEVLGNHEVVVKNLGPQLARLPGLAGMTLLASGKVALIYNPVALATMYGDAARAYTGAALAAPQADEPAAPAAMSVAAPLVMIVDDSLTVRRVTQRLLVREGYRVVVAKDGLEALEKLAEERPAVLLSDIEMPRMDGFDLARNVRADARLATLPIIMITSRIAQKHREVAAELGVDHYLGKPYSEEDLLALVTRYTKSAVAA